MRASNRRTRAGSDASGGRGKLIVAAADADDDLRDDREFVSGAAGFAKTGTDGRKCSFEEMALRVERHDQ